MICLQEIMLIAHGLAGWEGLVDIGKDIQAVGREWDERGETVHLGYPGLGMALGVSMIAASPSFALGCDVAAFNQLGYQALCGASGNARVAAQQFSQRQSAFGSPDSL
jgi:hypothetical protein